MWVSVRNSQGPLAERNLGPGELSVGRDTDSDLVLADERASRRHARFTAWPTGQAQVEDLGSTNGTWVNGARITGPTPVNPGDEIRMGGHVLTVMAKPAPAAPRWAPDLAAPPRGDAPADPVWVPAPAGEADPDGPVWAPPSPTVAPERGWAPVPGTAWLSAGPPAAGDAPVGPSAPPAAPLPRSRRPWVVAGAGAALVVVVVVVLVVTQLGGSGPQSARQLASRWGPSTLYVVVSDAGRPQDSGTAWVLDASRGLVVTNAHVVDGGTSYAVGLGARRQPAHLVGVSPCEDLAVLRIADRRGLRSFSLGSQRAVQAGEAVTALGYPAGSTTVPALAVTTGIVSIASTRFDQPSLETPEYRDVVQITAPINPGNSGGPLLNSAGKLIGINTAGITDVHGQPIQGEGFAIGVDRARQVLAGLAQGQSVGYTGMDLLFPRQLSDFDSHSVPEVDNGVIVPNAVPGSPAARAGFGAHGNAAVITSVNGQPLDGTLPSYCKAIGGARSGDTATFHVVLSNGGEADVKVPLA